MSFRSKVFILSGIYALIGILVAHQLVHQYHFAAMGINVLPLNFFYIIIFSLAVVFFLISITTIYIIARRSKTPISFKKRFHLLIPAFVGFIILFLVFDRNYSDLIVPVALILYGLILLNLNRFVSSRLIYLASSLLFLGLLSLFYNGSDWVFLILGFAVFPIIFGLVLMRKNKSKIPSI